MTSRICQRVEDRLDGQRVGDYIFRVIAQSMLDRGPRSLEKITGADLFLSVSLDGPEGFDKGLFVQAKYVAPAAAIDYVLLCLFGLAALVPPTLAWHRTIKLMDENGIDWKDFPATPNRPITWVVAFVIAAYVTIVCGMAFFELPHAF
jgi:hypothetical protein